MHSEIATTIQFVLNCKAFRAKTKKCLKANTFKFNFFVLLVDNLKCLNIQQLKKLMSKQKEMFYNFLYTFGKVIIYTFVDF